MLFRSVGIRVPQNEFCTKLINRFHKPIVSTSANKSGDPAPEYYDDIPDEILDAVDFIVDPDFEEECTHLPSQIIKVGLKNEIEIIRE